MAAPPPGKRARKTAQKDRQHRLTSAARLLPQVTGSVMKRRSARLASVFNRWPEIVGADIARRCLPETVTGPRAGGCLTLRVAAGFGLEIEMMTPQILDRINGFLGHHGIARLRIIQDPTFTPRQAPTPVPEPILDPDAEHDIAATIAPVEDEALRKALESFGRALFADSRRPR